MSTGKTHQSEKKVKQASGETVTEPGGKVGPGWWKKFERALTKVLEFALVISTFTVLGCVFGQIFFRVVLKVSIFGLDEIALIAAMWLYLLGAANCTREKTHIGAGVMHIFVKSSRGMAIVNIIVATLSLFLSGMVTKWSYGYFVWGLMRKSYTPSLHIDFLIPQSALFVGFILINFYYLFEVIERSRHFFKTFVSQGQRRATR